MWTQNMPPRTAVYCGTRNLYRDMAVSVRSLMANNGADRVILVIEDDCFPFPVPGVADVINATGQRWFPDSGPNYSSRWTWMVLLRTALAKFLPEEGRVLSLDADTIVTGDLSGLWETDLDGACLAAAPEPDRAWKGGPYFQMGVVLFDLDRMRRDGTADRLIRALNEVYYPFSDQDAVNDVCAGQIRELDSKYNANEYTKPTEDPRIVHFAGLAADVYRLHPLYVRYSTCKS